MRDFHVPGRGPAYAAHGMAATSMPQATLAALDVLRSGGNAMDAAIAAAAVLAVVEPHSTGIGGDVFCLYAPAGSGRVFALNGSGRAPAAIDLDVIRARGERFIDPHGPDSVTIPGAVSAWETLNVRFGSRGFDELLRRRSRLLRTATWCSRVWLTIGGSMRPGFGAPALTRI